jgi:hypothetical protein
MWAGQGSVDKVGVSLVLLLYKSLLVLVAYGGPGSRQHHLRDLRVPPFPFLVRIIRTFIVIL